MIKYLLFSFALVNFCVCQRRHKDDPFSGMDQQLFYSLANHYLWPWSQMFKAVAALDSSETATEPQIISKPDTYQINMYVKRFKPNELEVKVKNRYVTVEGKHKEKGDDIRFISSHFIQRFELPPGTKQDEVTAIYNENGILSVTAPKHELPPPPPERVIPIDVILPEKKTEKPEVTEETTTVQISSSTPLEQSDLVEATTHVGKTRKKELKTTTKTVKDNEVTKTVDGNDLDYSLIDSDSE